MEPQTFGLKYQVLKAILIINMNPPMHLKAVFNSLGTFVSRTCILLKQPRVLDIEHIFFKNYLIHWLNLPLTVS